MGGGQRARSPVRPASVSQHRGAGVRRGELSRPPTPTPAGAEFDREKCCRGHRRFNRRDSDSSSRFSDATPSFTLLFFSFFFVCVSKAQSATTTVKKTEKAGKRQAARICPGGCRSTPSPPLRHKQVGRVASHKAFFPRPSHSRATSSVTQSKDSLHRRMCACTKTKKSTASESARTRRLTLHRKQQRTRRKGGEKEKKLFLATESAPVPFFLPPLCDLRPPQNEVRAVNSCTHGRKKPRGWRASHGSACAHRFENKKLETSA